MIIKLAGKHFSWRKSTAKEKEGEIEINRKVKKHFGTPVLSGAGAVGGAALAYQRTKNPYAVGAASILGGLAGAGISELDHKINSAIIRGSGNRLHFEPVARWAAKHAPKKDGK